MTETKQATPHTELIAQLLDSRVSKTEREHAASREIERLQAECAQLRADAIDRQNNVVVSLRKRVMTLEIELGEYANPLNWEEDEQGVRRMWREPWTRTPTAYDGFESARKALES